ncbi:MAG: hypothetical protein AAF649_05560 [Verrucomicrobiota bacterium]
MKSSRLQHLSIIFLVFVLFTVPLTASVETEATTPDSSLEEKAAEPTLLFVQNAKRMTFAGETLTLFEVDPDILYFSDRPFRIAGEIGPEEMKEMVTESFQKSPPNAALVIFTEQGVDDCVITLTLPPSLEGNTLTIPGVKIVHGTPPSEGGICSLFIDTIRMRPPPPRPGGPRPPMPPPRP